MNDCDEFLINIVKWFLVGVIIAFVILTLKAVIEDRDAPKTIEQTYEFKFIDKETNKIYYIDIYEEKEK